MTSTIAAPKDTLYLTQLFLDPLKLFAFCRATGLPTRTVRQGEDFGYVVHAGLAAQLGKLAPQPFHVVSTDDPRHPAGMSAGRSIVVVGYTHANEEQLRSEAAQRPEARHEIIDWEFSGARLMPTQFREGRRLAFAVLACPTVRSTYFRENREASSSEVDAYVVAVARHGTKEPTLNREEVYRDWINQKLEAGGAKIESAHMTRFRLYDVSRRDNTRQLRSLTRPTAEFEGVLQVEDPIRFGALIARGVGRHRAFGFGMLRLSPAP